MADEPDKRGRKTLEEIPLDHLQRFRTIDVKDDHHQLSRPTSPNVPDATHLLPGSGVRNPKVKNNGIKLLRAERGQRGSAGRSRLVLALNSAHENKKVPDGRPIIQKQNFPAWLGHIHDSFLSNARPVQELTWA
jgi:hypothetical protein